MQGAQAGTREPALLVLPSTTTLAQTGLVYKWGGRPPTLGQVVLTSTGQDRGPQLCPPPDSELG